MAQQVKRCIDITLLTLQHCFKEEVVVTHIGFLCGGISTPHQHRE
jgi:hypothetical protein